jgi:hypothetical protein
MADRDAALNPVRELLIALALVRGGPRLAALLRERIEYRRLQDELDVEEFEGGYPWPNI